MEKDSLGLIETLGLVAAIEAADAGAKAANVALRGYEQARAGLITVMFTGDVAAVRAAVSAGAAAAKRVGTVVSVHVIARPNTQLKVSSNGAGVFPEPAAVMIGVPEEVAAPQVVTSEVNPTAECETEVVAAVLASEVEESEAPVAKEIVSEEIVDTAGDFVEEEEPEEALVAPAPVFTGRNKKDKVRKTRGKRKA